MNIKDYEFFGFPEYFKGDVYLDYHRKEYLSFIFEIGLNLVVITPFKIAENPKETKFEFQYIYDDFTHFDSFNYPGHVTYDEIVALLNWVIVVLKDHELFPNNDQLYKPFYRHYARRHPTWLS